MNHAKKKKRHIGAVISYMGTDLIIVLLLTVATLMSLYVTVLSHTLMRLVFSAAMLFFIPGYAFTAALYPKNSDINAVERALLSFGMSISLCPLIELVLCYTPWGLRLTPLVVSLTAFTVACSLVAVARRYKHQEEDYFFIGLIKAYRSVRAAISADKSIYDRALTVVLVLSVLLASFTIAFTLANPLHRERFTELYVLGPNGTAEVYPGSVSLNDLRTVTVGVVNHEYRNVNYDLKVVLNDGSWNNTLYTGVFSLADNQSWKEPINLTLTSSGTGMTVEFLLYADGNRAAPYRECHFPVNVLDSALPVLDHNRFMA